MIRKENKVYVVEELVGDWENPETESLLGVYYTLEQAEKAIGDFLKPEMLKSYPLIVGYSIAFMTILEEGTQELYCSIYKSVDEILEEK